ncbi:DUF1273 domain-containing protein [Lacticaseibacillus parakribbianus]|uniref:DUF1273 domain-containing protein n=1 Tax=Lacticaseibacillus parakribbianus TaxID=2970927 RepID=UPI0021CB8CD0|nr:DUF1273 domain-containing protein [Lacticaseibacillus parakribbianus]
MGTRLWLTGYRSWELNAYGDSDPKITVIKLALRNQLKAALDDGLEWVITGGEQGVEQWGAQVAVGLKKDYPELKVAVMLPFADFGHQWKEENQAALATLVQQVDFSASVSSLPYQSPKQLSGYTRFMAQHTDAALLVFDPDFDGKPAFAYRAAQGEDRRRPYPVQLINMPDLEEAARAYGEQQAAEHDPFDS